MKSNLGEWLNSPEGVQVLLACSRSVELKARKASINLVQLFREEHLSDVEELRQIVAGELAAWLLEHQETVSRDIADDLQANDISAVIAKIATKFLQHLLDRRRTYAVSPFHAYQRHLRKVISQAPDIRYFPTDEGSYFAYSLIEDLQFLPHAFWGLSFDGWPAPAVPLTEIEEQAGMLKLSRFYWDEATERCGDEYLQPLRELTRFVFAKYRFVAQRQERTETENDTVDCHLHFDRLQPARLAGDPLGPLQRQSERLDYDIVETQLATLAGQCLSGLSDIQADILWRAAEGQTLDEIAGAIGMKGASNVHYHLKKAQDHIRRFWSLWGNAQLSGFADEDEEEQFIFIEKIVEICKERRGGRKSI